MGWRFRKSIRIAKGVNLNFSKRGVSASVGIPGTGLRYTTAKSGARAKVPVDRSSPGVGGLRLALCVVMLLCLMAVCAPRREADTDHGTQPIPFGAVHSPNPQAEPDTTAVATVDPSTEPQAAIAVPVEAEGTDPKAESLFRMAKALETRNPRGAAEYYHELLRDFGDCDLAPIAEERLAALGFASEEFRESLADEADAELEVGVPSESLEDSIRRTLELRRRKSAAAAPRRYAGQAMVSSAIGQQLRAATQGPRPSSVAIGSDAGVIGGGGGGAGLCGAPTLDGTPCRRRGNCPFH